LTPAMISVIFTSRPLVVLFTFIPTFACFSLNFIASELENPFGNDDNDLPLAHFQSEMNNSLLMLLHSKSDHIAGVSPLCTIDFHTLMETRAVRVSSEMQLDWQSDSCSAATPSEFRSGNSTPAPSGSKAHASPREPGRNGGRLTKLSAINAHNSRHRRASVSSNEEPMSLRRIVGYADEDRDAPALRKSYSGRSISSSEMGASLGSFSPRTTPRQAATGGDAKERQLSADLAKERGEDPPAMGTRKNYSPRPNRVETPPRTAKPTLGLASMETQSSELPRMTAVPTEKALMHLGSSTSQVFRHEERTRSKERARQTSEMSRHGEYGDRTRQFNSNADVGIADSIDKLTSMLQDWGGKLQVQAEALSRNTMVLEGFNDRMEGTSSEKYSPMRSIPSLVGLPGHTDRSLPPARLIGPAEYDPCPKAKGTKGESLEYQM